MSPGVDKWLYNFHVRMATRFLCVFCAGVVAIIVLRMYHHEPWSLAVLIFALIGAVAAIIAGYYQYQWETEQCR